MEAITITWLLTGLTLLQLIYVFEHAGKPYRGPIKIADWLLMLMLVIMWPLFASFRSFRKEVVGWEW